MLDALGGNIGERFPPFLVVKYDFTSEIPVSYHTDRCELFRHFLCETFLFLAL